MSEQTWQNKKTKVPKRTVKRILLVAIVLVIAAFIYCFFCYARQSQSADEKLAAIEAARAIPDSENAATIYNKLLRNPNAASLLHYGEFLDRQSFDRTSTGPWLSNDYPELAAWIREHQYIIEKLLEASKFEKCRFPINISLENTSPQIDRCMAMRQWAFLLMFAANNDIAERRIDAAITKLQCIVQMENHFRQQPMLNEHIFANAVGKLALPHIARFVVEGDSIETHLQKIEAMPLTITDNWAKNLEEIRQVENLGEDKLREQFGPLDYLRYPILKWRMMREMPKVHDLENDVGSGYLRHIATVRGIRILIGLRRSKNKNGTWPKSLDSIKSLVPAEILVDPINNNSFVYKLTADSFTLYSKGVNRIDEGGKWDKFEEKNGADDWLIWPPKGYNK